MKKSRRDFLKMMGTALGGVTLSACGSLDSDSDSPPGGSNFYGPLPSGYRYYRVFNTGDRLPNRKFCHSLPGSAMINDQNEIYFHAIDDQEQGGCHELTMSFSDTPTIESMRTVIEDGDNLPDNRQVKHVRQSDISRHGSFVTVVKLAGQAGQAVYLEKEKGRFKRVVGFLDAIPGGGGVFSQAFGDVDIHDNDDVLLVARFSYNESGRPHQGVFFFPKGKNGPGARLVAADASVIPDADGIIRSFGLLDLNNGGNYVVQTGIEVSGVESKKSASSVSNHAGSALLMGFTDADTPSTLLTPAAAMNVSPLAKTSGLMSAAGDVIYGPRIGTFGNPAHIVHHTEDDLTLYYNGAIVMQTGDLSPNGYPVLSFGAPVVGDDGLLYYSIITTEDLELCAYNGQQSVAVLTRGDTLVDGSVVNDITFGMQTEHVDAQGRLCFIAEFEDASSAIVVGIPE